MLHRALIERLVPAWASVPFFSATLKQRNAIQHQRLWEETDVDLLSGVIADGDDWGDGFDVAQVQDIWRGALAGRAAARDELLLQRVVWRAAFTDHLAAVDAEPVPQRQARTLVVATGPERTSSRVLRQLATQANDVPGATVAACRATRLAVGEALLGRGGEQEERLRLH